LHGGVILKNAEYRKESSLSKEKIVLLPDLTLSIEIEFND
jgi:hypothetical protein